MLGGWGGGRRGEAARPQQHAALALPSCPGAHTLALVPPTLGQAWQWQAGAGAQGSSYLGNDVLELPFPPGISGVTDHGKEGTVVLLVLVLEEHQLRPQVRLLCGSQHLRGQPRARARLEPRVYLPAGTPRRARLPLGC